MKMRKKLIVGNWKMHGSHASQCRTAGAIVAARPFMADVAVCVPFPYLSETAVALAGTRHPLGCAGLLGARTGRLHG